MCILLFTCFISFGQKAGFAELINYYGSEKNFSGTAAVASNGQLEYLGEKGLSNRQSGIRIAPDAKFRICSITKTFTAVMILQLIEEGRMNLTSSIGTYLPDYTGDAKDSVTIEHLLTYSSGLRNCESYIGGEIYAKLISPDTFIANYCTGKLENRPGTKFSYNNGDYIVLGKIIEQLTGKSFEDNLRQRIFKPLNMLNTGMLRTNKKIPGLVSSYLYNDSLKTFQADTPYYIETFFRLAPCIPP